MKIMPFGDYYVWDCEWCDSRNRTLWTRIETGRVTCGVCYCQFSISVDGESDRRFFISERGSTLAMSLTEQAN